MKAASNQGYEEEAERLLVEYERLSFEEAHRHVLDYFPKYPVAILDIGSGTGRDAAYLAEQGHRIVAIEPTDALREGAQKLHVSPRIEWVDDGLPNLAKIMTRALSFDLILMAAVWMHLDRDERERAMPIVASLLKKGATLIMNIRHGPVPRGRRMFEISDDEMLTAAKESGLTAVHHVQRESILQRNRESGVTWSHFVFRKNPD